MKQWAERFWRAFLDSDYWWLEEEAMWGMGYGASLWEFYPGPDEYVTDKESAECRATASVSASPNGMADVVGELISADGLDARKAS